MNISVESVKEESFVQGYIGELFSRYEIDSRHYESLLNACSGEFRNVRKFFNDAKYLVCLGMYRKRDLSIFDLCYIAGRHFYMSRNGLKGGFDSKEWKPEVSGKLMESAIAQGTDQYRVMPMNSSKEIRFVRKE